MRFDDVARAFSRRYAFSRFQKVRCDFLRDLATAMKGGASLTTAVGESARRCEDRLQALVYGDIRDRISEGKKLATTLGAWFVPMERMLLEAFLESARTNEQIGQGLEHAINVIEPQERVAAERRKYLAVVIFTFVVCVGSVLITIPGITQVDRVLPRSKWPEFLASFFEAMKWLSQFWWLYAAIAAVLPFLAYCLLATWTGPVRRKWDARIPGFVIYRTTHGALTMIALGAFAGAGRGIGETCRALSRNANPWLRSYLASIQARAQDRKDADIVDVGLFDWRLMVRLACLCTGSNLTEALRSVGLRSSAEVAEELLARLRRAQRLTLLLIPVVMVSCIALMGAIYGVLISSLQRL